MRAKRIFSAFTAVMFVFANTAWAREIPNNAQPYEIYSINIRIGDRQ